MRISPGDGGAAAGGGGGGSGTGGGGVGAGAAASGSLVSPPVCAASQMIACLSACSPQGALLVSGRSCTSNPLRLDPSCRAAPSTSAALQIWSMPWPQTRS